LFQAASDMSVVLWLWSVLCNAGFTFYVQNRMIPARW